jgi:hypothetical protein
MDIYERRAKELDDAQRIRYEAEFDANKVFFDDFELEQVATIDRYRRISRTYKGWHRPRH